jgi:hypothetical protein
MTLRSFSLATISALLVFAAIHRADDAAAPNGTLAVSVTSSNAAALDTLTSGSVSVTCLDGSLQTRVALSAAASGDAVNVSLPPGLYLVAWQSDPSPSQAQPTPVASTPRAVVVAPGGTSSVALRSVPRAGAGIALADAALSDAGATTRLALR